MNGMRSVLKAGNLLIVLVAMMWVTVASAGLYSTWGYTVPIRFAGYGAAETLTNFPVLVVLSNNCFSGFNYNQFQSGSNDLAFTSDLGGFTNLNYEIEAWNTNGASYLWVQVPTLTANSSIELWWGATNQSAPACVANGSTWSNGYLGVWHMKEGVGTVLHDSASTNNGTLYNSPTWTNGVADGAVAFDGVSQYATMGNPAALQPQYPFTASIVAKSDLTTSLMFITDCATNGNGQYSGFNVGLDATGHILAATGNNAGNNGPGFRDTFGTTAGNLFSANVWHNITAVFNSASSFQIYLDGMPQAGSLSGTQFSPVYSPTNQFRLGIVWNMAGSSQNTNLYYRYQEDEVELSGVSRSSNWIWACWMNTLSNAVFQNYGALSHPLWPVIANLGAANVAAGLTQVSGTLLSTGASPTTVYLYCGTADGTTNPANWLASGGVVNLGQLPQGAAFTNRLLDLNAGTTYYYNYMASNSTAMSWGSATISPWFTTPLLNLRFWGYSAPVRFSGYNQAETLTNFPVLVVLSNNCFQGFSYHQFQSGSNDLAFTADAAGLTNLNYEIESWNPNGVSYVWVQVPALTINTSIEAWWGCAGQGVSAWTTNASTWSNGYLGVWHMKEGAGAVLHDSASTNNGTLYNNPTWTNGVADGAVSFDGISQYATMGNPTALQPQYPFTASVVAQSATTTNIAFIADCGAGSNGEYSGFIVALNSSGAIAAQTGNNLGNNDPGFRDTFITSATGLYTSNTWHNITATFNSSTQYLIYLDGVLQAATKSGNTFSPGYDATTNQFRLGIEYSMGGLARTNFYYKVQLDEVELSGVSRSSNWIWASWMNTGSNSTFQTYGAENHVHPSGFTIMFR